MTLLLKGAGMDYHVVWLFLTEERCFPFARQTTCNRQRGPTFANYAGFEMSILSQTELWWQGRLNNVKLDSNSPDAIKKKGMKTFWPRNVRQIE